MKQKAICFLRGKVENYGLLSTRFWYAKSTIRIGSSKRQQHHGKIVFNLAAVDPSAKQEYVLWVQFGNP